MDATDDAARLVIAEPPSSLPLPPGPYALRVAGLRARWPGGEVVGFGGLDLLVPAGRRVALVSCGRVGASALAAVLLRFVEYDGTVTLNDVELRDLSRNDVRGVIGRCARDMRLMPGTLADNVRSARPDAPDEEVAAVLRRAGLSCPPDTIVGDRDDAYSGLERQRVALARALLADTPMLIMDEPDGRPALTELLDAADNRTVLLAVHRPAVPGAAPILRHVDEVVSLSGL